MRNNTVHYNSNTFDLLRVLILIVTFLYILTITNNVHAQSKNKNIYKLEYQTYDNHKPSKAYIYQLLDSSIVFCRSKKQASNFFKLDTLNIKIIKSISLKRHKVQILNPLIGITLGFFISLEKWTRKDVVLTRSVLGGIIGLISNIGNKKNAIETLKINGNQSDYNNELKNLNYYSIHPIDIKALESK